MKPHPSSSTRLPPVATFHLLFVVPLLLVVGVWGSATPLVLRWILLSVGLVVVLFHGSKILRKQGKPVNVGHALLIGPLLVYVGAHKTILKDSEAEDAVYWTLIALALLAALYHGRKVVVSKMA
jgi:hypothetical protein